MREKETKGERKGEGEWDVYSANSMITKVAGAHLDKSAIFRICRTTLFLQSVFRYRCCCSRVYEILSTHPLPPVLQSSGGRATRSMESRLGCGFVDLVEIGFSQIDERPISDSRSRS